MIRYHLFISGKVQLVGFRSYIKKKADELKIKGWIKNLDDGRIEIIFEGEGDNIKKIIEYCKRGPLSAEVKNIEIKEEEYKNEFKDFEIKL